jgi:hypothetical protein
VRSSASRASLHPHAVVLDNKRSPLIEHAPAGVRAIPKCGLARCQGGASQDGWVAARLAAHGDRDPRACDDRSHWLCHPRITPWTAADATNSLGPPVAVVVPEPPGRGAVPAPATHRAPCAFPRLQVNAPMLVGALRKSGQNGRFEAYLASPMRLLVASRLRLLAPRVQWRVSPKRGSNPRSPKASLAFLAGETASSGIMSAQAARALDASHRQRHPPGRRTPSGIPGSPRPR